MAITATASKITALDTVATITAIPATSTVINTAETFEVTPSAPAEKVLIMCTAADSHGTVDLEVAAGDFHNASAVLELEVAQATTKGFILDPSKYLSDDGKYSIKATPATGKRLLTDHAFKMTVCELKAI